MLCTRCKKRTAVVFVARQENDKTINEGYCLQCAKELGIQPVNDMLAQMGLGSEEIEEMENELQDFLEGKVDDADGHALALPPFLQNMLKNPQMFAMGPFGAMQPPTSQSPAPHAGEARKRRSPSCSSSFASISRAAPERGGLTASWGASGRPTACFRF